MAQNFLTSSLSSLPKAGKTARVLLLTTLLGLGACEYQVNVRGNMPDPDEVAEILPGISNRSDVSEILGSPSTVSTFEDQVWYYIGQRTEQLAFFAPETTDRSVLVIEFNENGVVDDTRFYTVEDGKVIDHVSRKTPTHGKELTVVQQLIGNLGRFTPTE
ncbi:outer membrane protein assembly factor BamE [Rhodovibrionaceae bacterium A322]